MNKMIRARRENLSIKPPHYKSLFNFNFLTRGNNSFSNIRILWMEMVGVGRLTTDPTNEPISKITYRNINYFQNSYFPPHRIYLIMSGTKSVTKSVISPSPK